MEKKFMWPALMSVAFATLLQIGVSLHPYSGYKSPPLFGDYEAQRHWMEITFNLPVNSWYWNTENNDLMYWGLDYPPLTAYHSYIFGVIANVVNPEYIALNTSRGHESYNHKFFMRASVILSNLVVYVPALFWFFSSKLVIQNFSDVTSCYFAFFVALMYPGLMLIDNGHFQYNGVSLGLMVAAVTSIFRNKDVWSTIFFCLALNYKQMELYHAFPFFCYFLGKCISLTRHSFGLCCQKLAIISLTVISTFVIVWFPFLSSLDSVLQVIHRVFPLDRGIFEDKVANVWCSLHIIFKLRNSVSNLALAKTCLVVTFVAILPSSINLVAKPTLDKFLLALINSSLAFFLFSFQVHEKSILLVAIPVVLYHHNDPFMCSWFLIVSVFSMLPLFVLDGLVTPAVALLVAYTLLLYLLKYLSIDQVFSLPYSKSNYRVNQKVRTKSVSRASVVCVDLFKASVLGCAILADLFIMLKPPIRYPHLFPVLISLYSCIHFVFFLVYFNFKQIFMT
ncbi:dolichyl pyrophosphate Man9GlcNAc2 alpha-1,3-glucosyltransferase [Bacillus rossius redtenbacheri]|uniref:dolichyl pyrophosphate Man9GlcNAc2 alpha-1,3-glucosyltransferase n=1 Tax=Bacillus rossius redtenbacheri TaxID=93214 RepID=UPI002FDD0F86